MSSQFAETLTPKDVKIPSVTPGWNLDAWQYVPEGKTRPFTVIVMGHGLSCNKTMGLKQYAEEFVKLGYAVVVFDYRRWGASDGKPRHVFNVAAQLEDYRTVIKYCRQQQEFDPNRVIVWGTSFAGGHAVKLASEDSTNVFAAIGQCPYLGVTPQPPFNFTFLKIVSYALLDKIKLSLGLSPVLIDATAPAGQAGIMNAPDSQPGMFAIIQNVPGAKYDNTISASCALELPAYQPKATAKNIKRPTLVVHCEEDTLCSTPGAEEVAAASSSVQLARVKGAGHFDIYPGGSHYEEDLKILKEFLQRVAPV